MKSSDELLQTRLRTLADPSRFRILRLLEQGGRCVGAVAEEVELSQSCTTRHLQTLQRAGLVRRSPQGRQVEVSLTAIARNMLAALLGQEPATGADSHSDQDGASVGSKPPADRKQELSRSRRAPAPSAARANTPPSDTSPSPEAAAEAPTVRPPVRSELEDYLL